MLSLAAIRKMQPRQILVDTAPLLSVAFVMMRLARVHGIWHRDVSAKTFSSYGGLSRVARLSSRDVILVSASTSGSLAKELQGLGARQEFIVTLYFLLASGEASRPSGVLCDLTTTAVRVFGYQQAQNYVAADCPLCRKVHLLADLEGDQFLLQRRPVKPLRVVKSSQPDDARSTLEETTRQRLIRVSLHPGTERRAPLVFDSERVVACTQIRTDLIRHLRRFCPLPLGLLVRFDVSAAEVDRLVEDAGLGSAFRGVLHVDWSELRSVAPLKTGLGALVIFGCLDNHSRARAINATLRSIVPDGNVAYIAALTTAECAEDLRSLGTFLQYGERGSETYTFRTSRHLALPACRDEATAWQDELDLLDSLAGSGTLPVSLAERRKWLASTVEALDNIFYSPRQLPLAIQRDFVYLDTNAGKRDLISQADVYAVVLNALCCARYDNQELLSPRGAKLSAPIQWSQSVYGQVLLSPANLRDYNDSILKAAFLRAAHRSELMYSTDERLSEEMAQIVVAELAA